jgi:hypothetical protein
VTTLTTISHHFDHRKPPLWLSLRTHPSWSPISHREHHNDHRCSSQLTTILIAKNQTLTTNLVTAIDYNYDHYYN